MAGYGKGLGQHQNLDILSQQINYQTQYNMSYQQNLQKQNFSQPPPNWIPSTSRVDTLPLAAQRKPRILNLQWLS